MNNKISIKFSVGIILLLSLIAIGGFFYWQNKKETEKQQFDAMPKIKEYYESFRKKCKNSECCLRSVDRAEKDESLIYEGLKKDIVCPEGFESNALKCLDSYGWCSLKKPL